MKSLMRSLKSEHLKSSLRITRITLILEKLKKPN